MPKNMPGSIPAAMVGVLGDIVKKVAASAYTHEELELFAKRRNPFKVEGNTKEKKGSKKVPKAKPLPDIDWHKVYTLLGLKEQYEAFVLASTSKNVDKKRWLVQGLTISTVLAGYKKAGMTVETYGVDLEHAVDKEKEQRDPSKGSYWVSFQKTIEADPDQANKSAEDLAEHPSGASFARTWRFLDSR